MGHNCECVKMGLAHEKKSYLQEKANLFEIGSIVYHTEAQKANCSAREKVD